MEILLGLALATVAVIGWWYGNLFVCVFLTLGALLVAGFLALAMMRTDPSTSLAFIVGGALVIAAIWWRRLWLTAQAPAIRSGRAHVG